MVFPGYGSLWERPKSRSRRASDGDDGMTVSHGLAVRGSDGGADDAPAAAPPPPPPPPPPPKVLDDSKDDSKNKDSNKNKNKDDSTATTCTTSSSSSPPPVSVVPQTSPVVAATAAPTLVSTTSTSTSPIPTISTTPAAVASTVWLTTSEWTTITSVQTTTAVSAAADTSPEPTNLFRGQSDDDDCCHGKGHGPPPNNNKFAIAFGTLGGLGILVGFLWLAFLVYRWRKRRGRDNLSQRDYASSIGKPSRFNFKWPFGRSRYGGEDVQRQMNGPPGGPRRSNTSIMDEAMRGAYGSDDSSLRSVPHGYMDEKRQDPNYVLPVLDPTPIQQASLRKSIASWFRRSTSNHPLRLNPNSRWSRSTTKSSSTAGGLSRTTTAQSDASYSASIYSSSTGNAPPPMPDLDLQRTYTAAAAPAAVELPAPVPVFTPPSRGDGTSEPVSSFASPMPQSASRWSRSTASHERMSSLSTRTDATQTTISGGRESVPAMPQGTGLSPPGFHRPGGSKDLGGSMLTAERDTAELTSLREELLELYTQGARPASAVGLKK